MYSAFFRDLDDITEFSNEWTKDVGQVFYYPHSTSAVSEDNIVELGTNWRSATTEDNPDHNDTQDEARNVDYYYGVHGGTISPIVIDDNDVINLWAGYGIQEDIVAVANNRDETVFDIVDNWQWIQYGNKLNRRIDLLETNEKTGFDIIKDIAAITNSIIGFNNEQFFMMPRQPKTAKLQTTLPINESTNPFTIIGYNRNGSIPANGILMINKEIITYTLTGRDMTAPYHDNIQRYTRATNRTVSQEHTVGSSVYWVDHIPVSYTHLTLPTILLV